MNPPSNLKMYFSLLFLLLTTIFMNSIACKELNEAPPSGYFIKEKTSLGFLQEDKVDTIIKFLLEKYNITSVQEALEHNVVFPLVFNPQYEGKAKKLQDQIEILKKDLQKFKETGARESLIKITQQLLDRTIREYDIERAPQLKKVIEIQLTQLLRSTADEYLDIIIPFIQTDHALPDLYDLCSLIANAIVNGNM